MPILRYQRTISGFGPELKQVVSRSGSSGGQIAVTVPKGKASVSFDQTTSSVGTIVLATGHGIITSQLVDIYWSGGNRRNVIVGTVAGTSVPISGGTGTNLPVDNTALIVSPQVSFSAGIPPTSGIEILGRRLLYGSRNLPTINGILQLTNSVAGILVLSLRPNKSVIHDIEGGDTTDVTDATYVSGKVSNPSSVYDATFQMFWITN